MSSTKHYGCTVAAPVRAWVSHVKNEGDYMLFKTRGGSTFKVNWRTGEPEFPAGQATIGIMITVAISGCEVQHSI